MDHKVRLALAMAAQAGPQIEFVLGTINAPRPHQIDARSLVLNLVTTRPDPEWRPHMAALFDEVSVEAIHDLVLADVVSFENLYRAACTWDVTDGANVPWIKEMTDLRQAKSVTSGREPPNDRRKGGQRPPSP